MTTAGTSTSSSAAYTMYYTYRWRPNHEKRLRIHSKTTPTSVEVAEDIRQAAFDTLGFMVYNGEDIYPGTSLRQLEGHEHQSAPTIDGQVSPTGVTRPRRRFTDHFHTQEHQQELSDKNRSTRRSSSGRTTPPSGVGQDARHVQDNDMHYKDRDERQGVHMDKVGATHDAQASLTKVASRRPRQPSSSPRSTPGGSDVNNEHEPGGGRAGFCRQEANRVIPRHPR